MKDPDDKMIPPEHQLWALVGACVGVLLTLLWGRNDIWIFLKGSGGFIGGVATSVSVIVFIRLTYLQLAQQRDLAEIAAKREAHRHAAFLYSKLASHMLIINMARRDLCDVVSRPDYRWAFHDERMYVVPNSPGETNQHTTMFKVLQEMRPHLDDMENAAAHISAFDPNILAAIISLRDVINRVHDLSDETLESVNEMIAANMLQEIVISWTRAFSLTAYGFSVESEDDRRRREDEFPGGAWLNDIALIRIAETTNPPIGWGAFEARAKRLWESEFERGDLPVSDRL